MKFSESLLGRLYSSPPGQWGSGTYFLPWLEEVCKYTACVLHLDQVVFGGRHPAPQSWPSAAGVMLRLLAGAFSLAAGLRPEKTLGTSLADSLEHLQGDDECKDLGAEIGEQGSAAWCLCNLDQSRLAYSPGDELAEQLLEKNRTLLVYVDQAASAGKNVRQAETSSELDLAAESGTVEAMERQLDVALASLTDLQNSKNALDLEVMEHKSTLADKKSELIQCKVFAANAMDDAKEQIDEDLDEMIESFSSRAAAEAKMETDTAEELKS
ncbi:unnamed protein product [Effrenium voratum]|nr:unnamed protein product [Effrenium voratum]